MKKNNYKTMFLPIIMSLLVVTFVFVGCKPKPGGDTPSQNVNVSDFLLSSCLDEDRRGYYDSDTIYVTAINDNSLKIRTTNTLFNCCSEEFWEDVKVEGNSFYIFMNEYYEEACDCVCPRSVEFILNNLVIGQTYKIIIRSRNGYGYYSFEVVFEKDADLMFIR